MKIFVNTSDHYGLLEAHYGLTRHRGRQWNSVESFGFQLRSLSSMGYRRWALDFIGSHWDSVEHIGGQWESLGVTWDQFTMHIHSVINTLTQATLTYVCL